MARNLYKLWLVLLVVSGGIALWFSGVALSGLWKYIQLNAETAAVVSKLKVRDLPSSRFVVEADFSYEVKGVVHKGKTIFESPQFLNRFTAENHVKSLEGYEWRAWYKKSNPSLSSLEKDFPQKRCLHALLTVGVFVYFYFSRSLLPKFL